MNYKLRSLIVTLFFVSLSSTFSNAQCKADELAEMCISQLDSNYSFIKSYPLDNSLNDQRKIEYSYVLTKDTDYLIRLCTENDSLNSIVLNIFDQNRKNVASNMSDSILNTVMNFQSGLTGIYYLQFSAQDSSSFCAGSILGFKLE